MSRGEEICKGKVHVKSLMTVYWSHHILHVACIFFSPYMYFSVIFGDAGYFGLISFVYIHCISSSGTWQAWRRSQASWDSRHSSACKGGKISVHLVNKYTCTVSHLDILLRPAFFINADRFFSRLNKAFIIIIIIIIITRQLKLHVSSPWRRYTLQLNWGFKLSGFNCNLQEGHNFF